MPKPGRRERKTARCCDSNVKSGLATVTSQDRLSDTHNTLTDTVVCVMLQFEGGGA